MSEGSTPGTVRLAGLYPSLYTGYKGAGKTAILPRIPVIKPSVSYERHNNDVQSCMEEQAKLMISNMDRNPDGFTQSVAMALEKFTDPVWLGADSPLAAPYFLGHILDRYELGETDQQRGHALQSALRSAATHLTGEQRELLSVAYFERNLNLNNAGIAMALQLPERTFYRNKNQTIQDLGKSLNQMLLPPLRPETPANQAMIGRTQVFSNCLAALYANRSVYVTGASGTGKTTLGTAIVKTWNAEWSNLTSQDKGIGVNQRTFWFTVRPGLNDYLASFIFALGYFLRSHGAFHTWRQLVADRGKIRAEQILGLIRYDLKALQDTQLLLCIDEVDLLQSERSEHAQLLHMLEELRQITRILLLGQQVVLEASEYYTLRGFSEIEVEELLAQKGLTQLNTQDRRQLMEHTRGNPALLVMVMALHDFGDDIKENLGSLGGIPSMEALFVRIWHRLSIAERHLLMQLAVFRSPSPTDAWREQGVTLDMLNKRGLLQLDNYGGVYLPPHIRGLAYTRISAEIKSVLHRRAAEIREARGENVAAMYHYVLARQPALAIWLWYASRTLEIERGHGPVALDMLAEISSTDLTDDQDRNILRAARGQLFNLAGLPEEAETELDAVAMPEKGGFAAYIQQLHGSTLEMQGRAEYALEKYRSALEALTGTYQLRDVTVHTRIGFLYEFHFQNRKEAVKEALLARIKAEGFHGNIEEMSGNYAEAHERYQAAFKLASELGDLASLSRAYSQLGVLTLKLGDFESAIPLIEKAIDCDEKRGDVASPLYDQLNLAYAHLLAGRNEKSYQVARDGLNMAERLHHTYLIAGLAAGVGEACYALKWFDKAERYAQQSLAQEEGFFRCSALTIIGLVRSARHEYMEAEKMVREAVESARYAEDKFSEAYALHQLCNVLCAAGNLSAARDAIETALDIYKQLKLSYKIEEAQAVIASMID